MSDWYPNLVCTRCRTNYYSAYPEGLVGSPCLRHRVFFGSCMGSLQLHANYVKTVERNWIEDGIALAELYANHHGHRL